jgi:anaerobic ribonucleoside-triphosphate reductase activating protein
VTITLSRIAYPVTALGPGRRIALWVAGCPLRCRGCITPGLLDPAAGKAIPVARLARRLLQLPLPIDGLTLSGGEPFAQAAALGALLAMIKAQRPQWDVLAFSGFTQEHLQRGDQHQQRLLSQLDMLVDGPYQADRASEHPLLASANQRLHLLSERAEQRRDEIAALPRNSANLGLHRDGTDWLIGIIDGAARATLHSRLDARTPAGRSPTRCGTADSL